MPDSFSGQATAVSFKSWQYGNGLVKIVPLELLGGSNYPV